MKKIIFVIKCTGKDLGKKVGELIEVQKMWK